MTLVEISGLLKFELDRSTDRTTMVHELNTDRSGFFTTGLGCTVEHVMKMFDQLVCDVICEYLILTMPIK